MPNLLPLNYPTQADPALGLRSELFPRRVCGYIIIIFCPQLWHLPTGVCLVLLVCHGNCGQPIINFPVGQRPHPSRLVSPLQYPGFRSHSFPGPWAVAFVCTPHVPYCSGVHMLPRGIPFRSRSGPSGARSHGGKRCPPKICATVRGRIFYSHYSSTFINEPFSFL
jgi:hypothetical protein